MASLWLQWHYFNLLEEELADRARAKNIKSIQQGTKKRARPSENMCSNSQMEKVVEYMEINGDLSKLTHRGGGNVAGGRSLADAGWKELAVRINSDNVGAEKTPTQLRRNWGDFKSKVRKKAAKLQEYKDLPVGKAPLALTDLESRVVALENIMDLTAEDQVPASAVYGSESETNESANWQPSENIARHTLELPLPATEIQVKKEMTPISVRKTPEKPKHTMALGKVSPKNLLEEKDPLPKGKSNVQKQASVKIQNEIADYVAPTINNGHSLLKAPDQVATASLAPKIAIINIDSSLSPNHEQMEMEREFAHLTQLYEKTQTMTLNNEKKINYSIDNTNRKLEKYLKDIRDNGIEPKNLSQLNEPTKSNGQTTNTCIENTNKKLEKYFKDIRDTGAESKTNKHHAAKHGTKRNLISCGNLHENQIQNPDDAKERGPACKKFKMSSIEEVVSLFLENMTEQRQLEMKREEKRIELEERRLENEKESLRQRDVQLAQNAQILNVVVQLAELTERVLNKRTN